METRDIYNLGKPQSLDELVRSLNFLFNRISDRLDRMEGLRGNPRYYSSLLEFILPKGLTVGQFLKCVSGKQVSFGDMDLGAEDGITGFLPLEKGGLGADVSDFGGLLKVSFGGPSQVLISDLGESIISKTLDSEIRDLLGLGTVAVQDAENIAVTGGQISGIQFSDSILSILDENGVPVHQFHVENIPYLSEVNNWLISSPILLPFGTMGYQMADAVNIAGGEIRDTLLTILDEKNTVIHQFPFDFIADFSEAQRFLRDHPSIWTFDEIFPSLIAYSPVVTPGAGSFVNVTASGYYLTRGKLTYVWVQVNLTNIGTGSGILTVTLPKTSVRMCFLAGREAAATGHMLQVLTGSGTADCQVYRYDNFIPMVNGYVLVFSGFYENS